MRLMVGNENAIKTEENYFVRGDADDDILRNLIQNA